MIANLNSSRLVTAAELSKTTLPYSPRQIQKLAEEGEIGCYRIRKKLFFCPDEVLASLRKTATRKDILS